jgi:hypothetical protein
VLCCAEAHIDKAHANTSPANGWMPNLIDKSFPPNELDVCSEKSTPGFPILAIPANVRRRARRFYIHLQASAATRFGKLFPNSLRYPRSCVAEQVTIGGTLPERRGASPSFIIRQEASMAEPTYEELKAKLAQLEKEVETKKRSGDLIFKVGEKGGVSVYGLGRFPVTLYYEQWNRLLGAANEIKQFMEENKSKLKLKEQGQG